MNPVNALLLADFGCNVCAYLKLNLGRLLAAVLSLYLRIFDWCYRTFNMAQ